MDFNYAHTLIDVGSNYEYHDELRTLRGYDPPVNWSSYVSKLDNDEPGYGHMEGTTDPYGDEFRIYKAGDIAAMTYVAEYPKLRAAIAYVRELAPDTWIALYWH
jgi:hypothetical protein